MSLERILREQRVVICCGSGGVGKTTTSAVLALQAALLGRRAVVCTIDPARRLANSLGLSELGSELVQVPRERLEQVGLTGDGTMHAVMLDTKGTFDRLIARYATDPERRERILANKFYQQMSSTVVGSSDYMAMEKLYELHEGGEFDVIILDTPPTKHALDFLEAPTRMTRAFDEETLSVFLKPWADAGKRSLGFLGRALGKVIDKVDKVLGLEFVADLADFFRAFEGMYEGFRTRAQRVDALLREPFTSFVVVTAPQPLPMEEAGYFCERLREFEMNLAQVIVNRAYPSALADPAALRDRLAEDPEALRQAALDAGLAAGADSSVLEPLLAAFLEQEQLAMGDVQRIEAFQAGPARDTPLAVVPRFSQDVYDVSGLDRLRTSLFPPEASA